MVIVSVPLIVTAPIYVMITVSKLNGSQSQGSADVVKLYLYGSAFGTERVNVPNSLNRSKSSRNTLPRQ